MSEFTRTKIVCTIGPATWNPNVMKDIINNGMNCARVNGAFADKDELNKVTKLVRDVSREVALMVDVKGPEIRLNKFTEAKKISQNSIVKIGNDNKEEIYIANYKDLYKLINIGQKIVVGDGDVEMIVEDIKITTMYCKVNFGNLLKPGKAINLPGLKYTASILTEKDIENLEHAINLDWDYVSASFIQNASSAREIKKYLKNSKMKLIAKIEDEEGVNNIKEILDEVDGVMIARGGLGVELGIEKVPIAQRIITEEAIKKGKLVIIATQMLESMTYNPIPTRAEANDVATAVFLGTDAVMLSGETSAGMYPAETVKMMKKIIIEAEKSNYYQKYFVNYRYKNENYAKLDDLIKSNIDNIFVYTELERNLIDLISYVANLEIKSKIFVLISNIELSKQICLFKGVNCLLIQNMVQFEDINQLKEYIITHFADLINTKNHQNEKRKALIHYSNNEISYCLV